MELPRPDPSGDAGTPTLDPGLREPLLARRLVGPLFLVACGVFLIMSGSVREALTTGGAAWNNAVLVLDAPPPEEEAARVYPVSVRRLPEDSPLVDELNRVHGGPQVVSRFGLDKAENVVMLSAPPGVLAGLVGTGRAPEPGRFEALAGDLARHDAFTLDGQPFTVVGRAPRGVGGVTFAYVVPRSETVEPFFTPEQGARQGWLDPDGKAIEAEAARIESWAESGEVHLIGTPARTESSVAWLVIAGLAAVALGGSVAQYRALCLLGREGQAKPGPLTPIIDEMRRHPWLLAAVHVLLYGLFFGGMAIALVYPVANLRIAHFVREEFASGELRYIGDAYASGNLLLASAATFFQNFFIATVLYTVIPSLFVPWAGLVKNAVTFSLVGFVMAPQWAGAAAGLTYHSITMALELEAYIVASFAITIFPVRVGRALFQGGFHEALSRALHVITATILLTGIMLAAAATYEAATLILLR